MLSKQCTTCGQVKPLVEYNRDRKRLDGRKGRCRVCTRRGDSPHLSKDQAQQSNPSAARRQVELYVEPIEQAYARGWTPSEIVAFLGCTLEQVEQVAEEMDSLAYG